MNKELPLSLQIEHECQNVYSVAELLSPKEQHRIYADLCQLSRRVRAGEYQRARFVKNAFNIQDRSEELLDDLSFLGGIGRVWQELLSGLRMTKKTSVVDIGCGLFPKVELGLFYRQFTGRVTLVDMSQHALRRALSFIDFFNPAFTSDGICADLFSGDLPSADIVTGNHLLDDVILSSYCLEAGLKPESVYSSERSYARMWRKIRKENGCAVRCMKRMADSINRIVCSNGSLVLFDYLGHSHMDLGLSFIRDVVAEAQESLRKALAELGFESVTTNCTLPSFGRVTPVRDDIVFMTKG